MSFQWQIKIGAACLLLSACTATHTTHTQSSTDRVVSRPSMPGTASVLTPSFPSGSTTCGSYIYAVTIGSGTIALASCSGLLGSSDVRTIELGVGATALLTTEQSGVSWTARPSALVRRRGATFVMVKHGRVVITGHHVLCDSLPHHRQPRQCDALNIVVH